MKKNDASVIHSGRRPTILDVAAACGVSPATVSNVLAEKRHIAAQTRALVLSKVKELGYVASTTARALRMNRTWTVGVVVGDIANPFSPEVVRGAEDTLWRNRNNLILCNTGYESERKIAYLKSLIDKRVDGLILVTQSLSKAEANALDLSHLPPLVTINRTSEAIDADHVAIDNHRGVTELMEHLFSLGHTRIAFVKGLKASSSAAERFRAYRSAIKRAGLEYDPALVIDGDYTMESGAHAGALLMRLPSPPTAIVAANDRMAIGVLGVLRDQGVAVPEAMSVAGFDDIDMSSHPLINLTTINQPKFETGKMAAKLLLERVEGGADLAHRTVKLQPQLIVRATTGPARKRARL